MSIEKIIGSTWNDKFFVNCVLAFLQYDKEGEVMIEIVYTSNDKEKSNDVIKLPKNIKQVGNIRDSRKIYIEDYAINHINEAHEIGMDKVAGVLLGVAQKSGSDKYLFVKGAITVPDVFISESEISISDNDWTYIYEISGKYFPSLEVVGWFISLDGINASVLRTMKKTHTGYFAGGEKVLFAFDRQENSKYFYTFENNQLVKQSGYTIYYERNEEMQDYMVDMRNGKRIEVEIPDRGCERVQEAVPRFRDVVSDNNMNVGSASRKQSFVNYCANVALVVLVLFVGMYVLDKQDSSNAVAIPGESTSNITSVLKVDGKVYPTTGAEVATTEATTVASVTTATEQATSVSEPTTAYTGATTAVSVSTAIETTAPTTGSYITINNNRETTAAAVQTEPKATAASATFTEHKVKKGENLISICKAYYGDISMVDTVMEMNGIEDMDKIYIGQVIKLP